VDLNEPASSPVDVNASRGDFIRGESVRYARMADLLEARVPALDVRPIGGGRFTLRVRGRTALANAEPVIIIDGMRYSRGGADMLADIAPREVRRIEVVKDAASIAGIFGIAPGGVVVVTTWRH
jgi:outer membrane cobalamin receptor